MTMTPPQPFVPPPPYVAGVVTVPGSVANLLDLIRNDLQSNCPGSCVELRLEAQSGSISVGAASDLAGPLTADNCAYTLEPGTPRIYLSGYPGHSVPLGSLQVIGGGSLHVEVVT